MFTFSELALLSALAVPDRARRSLLPEFGRRASAISLLFSRGSSAILVGEAHLHRAAAMPSFRTSARQARIQLSEW